MFLEIHCGRLYVDGESTGCGDYSRHADKASWVEGVSDEERCSLFIGHGVTVKLIGMSMSTNHELQRFQTLAKPQQQHWLLVSVDAHHRGRYQG